MLLALNHSRYCLFPICIFVCILHFTFNLFSSVLRARVKSRIRKIKVTPALKLFTRIAKCPLFAKLPFLKGCKQQKAVKKEWQNKAICFGSHFEKFFKIPLITQGNWVSELCRKTGYNYCSCVSSYGLDECKIGIFLENVFIYYV